MRLRATFAVGMALLHLGSFGAGIDEGLIGHFTFDFVGPSSTLTNSVSGEPSGTICNKPGQTDTVMRPVLDGRINGGGEITAAGIEFTSASQFADFATQNFTIAGWFRADAPPSARALLRAVVVKGRTTQITPGWAIYLRYDEATGGEQLAFAGTDGAKGNVIISRALQGFHSGQWMHFAVVVDRRSKVAILYANGVQIFSGALGELGSMTTPAPLSIGRWNNGSALFGGALDDFGLWSRVLSGAEIEGIYAKGLRGVALNGPVGK